MKTLAMGVGATATLPVAAAKQPSGQVQLDTGGMPAVANASITQEDGDNYHIKMSGIVPPEGDDSTYVVSLLDDYPAEKAPTSASDVGNPSLQNASLLQTKTPISAKRDSNNEDDNSTVTSEQGTMSGTPPSQENSGSTGVQPLNNMSKGVKITSTDPAALKTSESHHWMDWYATHDELHSVDSHWKWRTRKYTAPPSDWNHESQWLSNYDWDVTQVSQKYHVDYINWTWSWNHHKTESFHRINNTAHADGALTWSTDWWHTGDDSHLLSGELGFIY